MSVAWHPRHALTVQGNEALVICLSANLCHSVSWVTATEPYQSVLYHLGIYLVGEPHFNPDQRRSWACVGLGSAAMESAALWAVPEAVTSVEKAMRQVGRRCGMVPL